MALIRHRPWCTGGQLRFSWICVTACPLWGDVEFDEYNKGAPLCASCTSESYGDGSFITGKVGIRASLKQIPPMREENIFDDSSWRSRADGAFQEKII